jgi:S-formylglutathione hydrolase FrmB
VIYVGVTIPTNGYRSTVLAPPMKTSFFLENQRRGDVDTKLNGIGDYYYGWIANDLKRHIDATYRTDSSSKNTAILGFSSSGSGAFVAAMLYPQTFSSVGTLYPAFWLWENWFHGVIANSGHTYSYKSEDGDIRKNTPSVKNISHMFIYIGGQDNGGQTCNESWSNSAALNVYDQLKKHGAGSKSANYLWWDQGRHGEISHSTEIIAFMLKSVLSE